MHLSDEFRLWLIEIVTSDLFQQIAPLVVLLLVPALVFFASTRRSSFFGSVFNSIIMGLDNLGLSWMWSSNPSNVASSKLTKVDKKGRKHIRTRAEQIELNGIVKDRGERKFTEDDGYYPGLVNVSGTYCFMNSTLQALASLSYLQPHIDAAHAKAEALDVPTPVIDSLKDLLQDLNNPRSSYHSIRPLDIIDVLSKQTEGRPNSLFHTREHQDAQELFQLLSECIKNEIAAVDKEGARDRGFGALAQSSEGMKEIGKTVFDGLTANRRSCVICGYTEAVMHFPFDNWQLSVPRLAASCRLEDCLEDYTRLEILKDCICRKCSLVATHSRLQGELALLKEQTRPEAKPSTSKKRRLKEVKKMEARVKEALAQGRIEDELKDVRIEKVFSTASTKQAMIARPPPVLALHLNRSIHYGQYAAKNNCRVIFPEVLDLTPYTTSGSLSTIPTASISTPPPAVPRSTTPTPSTYGTPHTIYRLSAVVCHYGNHSFGHYICYRRKPKHPNVGKDKRWSPPKLVDPMTESTLDNIEDEGAASSDPRYIWEDGDPAPGTGWLRISDDAVTECGIESVLAEGGGVFMLYYERAVQDRPGIYPSLSNMRASEETLRPEMKTFQLNGSVNSLVSEVGVGILSKSSDDRESLRGSSVGLGGSQIYEPRVIRSVAAGRARSASVQPPSLKRGSSAEPGSQPSTSSTPSSLPSSSPLSNLSNGSAHHLSPGADPSKVLSSSAPSIVSTKKASPSKPSPSKSKPSTATSPSSVPKSPLPLDLPIQTPQPHHALNPSTIADLKA